MVGIGVGGFGLIRFIARGIAKHQREKINIAKIIIRKSVNFLDMTFLVLRKNIFRIKSTFFE
jgi:hypothetical protein